MTFFQLVSQNRITELELKLQKTECIPRTSLLWEAVHRGYLYITDLLIQKGVNPLISNKKGLNTLMLICQNRRNINIRKNFSLFCVVSDHMKDQDFWQTDSFKNTLLHFAATGYAGVEIISYLLDLGLDPTAENSFNQTCFHIAARHGQSSILRLLYQACVDQYHMQNPIDMVDHFGHTPLMYASMKGHISTVKTLLQYPMAANPNILYFDRSFLLRLTHLISISREPKKSKMTQIQEILLQEMDNTNDFFLLPTYSSNGRRLVETASETASETVSETASEIISELEISERDENDSYESDSDSVGDPNESEDESCLYHITFYNTMIPSCDFNESVIRAAFLSVQKKIYEWCRSNTKNSATMTLILEKLYYLSSQLQFWKLRMIEEYLPTDLIDELLFEKTNIFNLPYKNEYYVHILSQSESESVCTCLHLLIVSSEMLGSRLDLNIQNAEGNTALLYACKNNNIEIVSFLLQHDAELMHVNKRGESCWNMTSNQSVHKYLTIERKKQGFLFLQEMIEEKIVKITRIPLVYKTVFDDQLTIYDIVSMEDVYVKNFLKNPDHILIVFGDKIGSDNIFGFSTKLITNINESLYVDCKRDENGAYVLSSSGEGKFPFYGSVPRPFQEVFLKLQLSVGQYYVYLHQFLEGIVTNVKFFYLNPSPIRKLQYTTSYDMKYGINRHHGQQGTEKNIYDIITYGIL